MSIFDSIKNFFLPDENTSAQRRLDVFGTTSKAVVGTEIIAGAGAAILAPIAIGAGAVSAAGSAIAGASFTSQLVGAGAVLIGTGAVITNPTLITKAPAAVITGAGKLVGLGSDLAKTGSNPTLANLKDIVANDKEATAIVLGGVALLGGAAVIGGVSNLLNTNAVKANTKATLESISQPSSPKVPSASPSASLPMATKSPTQTSSNVPITPQTQVIGREAGASVRHKHRAKLSSMPQFNIHISNRNTFIQASHRDNHGYHRARAI